MQDTRFQNESAITEITHKQLNKNRVTDTQLQSLLCGINLRSWLTTDERQLLDQLVDENAVIFLLTNDQYLHPDRIEIFPVQELKHVENYQPGAIFTRAIKQRFGSQNLKTVSTAVIGSEPTMTLTLGMISPDLETESGHLASEFEAAVAQFNRAWKVISKQLSPLLTALDSDAATLIVDRSSGRILALNKLAASILNKPDREISGRPFGDFKAELSNSVNQSVLSLKNLTVGELSLTLFTIKPVRTRSDDASAQIERAALPGRHLVHQMKNSLSGIMSAISFLQETAQTSNTQSAPSKAETAELLDILNQTTTSLCYQVESLDTFINFKSLTPVSIDVKAEVQEAIRRVSATFPENHRILFKPEYEPGSMTLPPGVLSLVCDSVLRSHICPGESDCATLVSFALGSSSQLVIAIESDHSHNDFQAAFQRDWLAYVDYLSRLLTDNITVEQLQTRRKLMTKIDMAGAKHI